MPVPVPVPAPPAPTVPSDEQRRQAAAATAENPQNACAAIRPFYWEVGRAQGMLASGAPAHPDTGARVDGQAPMGIASASKWLYASWVVQRRQGQLTDGDRKFLAFKSGYTSFGSCTARQTVDSCLASGNNGQFNASTEDRFFYNGGHMQKHASLAGLGALDSAGLAAEMKAVLGQELPITYLQAQPAGGAATSAAGYGAFLRKLLAGQLLMGRLLGNQAVCTNPATCGLSQAVYAPSPDGVSWHYALGHWVEDDPASGDGAFSSPGAFGFYPWIDASGSTYGVVARAVANGAKGSVYCGQLIRQAWASGVAR